VDGSITGTKSSADIMPTNVSQVSHRLVLGH